MTNKKFITETWRVHHQKKNDQFVEENPKEPLK